MFVVVVAATRHLDQVRDTHGDDRGPLTVTVTRLEAVHLQLLRLGQPGLGQPLANVLALVTLKLQHLAVLRVLHYRSVARKFLGRDANWVSRWTGIDR